MNTFSESVSKVFRGALEAFKTFPASVGCALAFAVVTGIRIQLDWPQQEPLNFLFGCLHWAFALGAILSLAAITAAQSRVGSNRAFLAANILGVAAAALTFLGLYLFGAADLTGYRYDSVSEIAAARVTAVMLVSFLVFIILAAYPKERSDFASSFFMSHKAFFIAIIYGAVIFAGTSGVARAIQGLLYRDMSGKVYMYLGTLAGFLTFTIFTGYFPDFRKNNTDERREIAQRQPRFIEVLFGYIMIPIMLALTVVLLIWTGKTVFSGMNAPFIRLSSIAAAYTLGGLWLHVMTAEHKSGLAKLYRRVYAIASVLILVFEAWAVINRLQFSGLKTTEYFFILIWVLAAAAAILLLIRKARSYTWIALLACVLAIFSVLPAVGYNALPITAQVNRLEGLLSSEGILVGGELKPAAKEPEQSVRESITDAVSYLSYSQDAKLPAWFDKELGSSEVFKSKLGFEQAFPKNDGDYGGLPTEYLGTYLTLAPGTVDISEYRWALTPQNEFEKGDGSFSLDGDRGTYRIYWRTLERGIPTVKVVLEDKVIVEQSLSSFVDDIAAKYPPSRASSVDVTAEEMSYLIETNEVKLLLVFNNISINVDTTNDRIDYWLGLSGMYIKENP